MILDFSKELEEIRAAKDDLEASLVLAKLFFKGRSEGIEHAVRIVQRKAMNPMPIVNEIRKPVR